jgi:predicted O-methyltransferase YrrM
MEAMRRLRRRARTLLNDAAFVWQARVLPRPVAVLQVRSRLRARRTGDVFSLTSATRPSDLATLLGLAGDRLNVVELGTGTAWTAAALAAADPRRRVTSFDPVARPERERYLALLGPAVRARVELIEAPGASGPQSGAAVDMLYIDSSHERDDVVAEFGAWTPVLASGSLVVLDDYGHATYPGVAQAVAALGLDGTARGTLFVHVHAPGGDG